MPAQGAFLESEFELTESLAWDGDLCPIPDNHIAA